uniref:Ig-like domain-containing protein n=1 Tax=Roseomonas rosulenta TaxID=2748667 RepID=UPI0018DEF452
LAFANLDDTGVLGDGVTRDSTFDLSLTGATALRYEVSTDGGSNWATTAAAQVGVADGSYQYRAVVADAAGNEATSNVVSVTIDTTAPLTTVFGIDISNDTNIDGDFITAVAVQTVTATLSQSLAADERLFGSADAGNTWIDVTGFVVADKLTWANVILAGSSSLQFQVTDVAGNDGALAVQDYQFPGPTYAVSRDGLDFVDPALTYTGPVDQLEYYWFGTNRTEAVRGTDFADFIVLFGADDAADGGAGNDVLDGGTGSNFLTGGSGSDTFFVDARGGNVTWSTVTDFEAGEQVAVFGWRAGVSSVTWLDNAGWEGWTGVTMHADIDGNGAIDTSVTWTGLTRADIPTPIESAIDGTGVLWFL